MSTQIEIRREVIECEDGAQTVGYLFNQVARWQRREAYRMAKEAFRTEFGYSPSIVSGEGVWSR